MTFSQRYSEVVYTTSNKHDQVIKAKLVASKSLFDNTTSFNSTNSMLYFDADSRDNSILSFLRFSQLFAFWFLGWHLDIYISRFMTNESGILP